MSGLARNWRQSQIVLIKTLQREMELRGIDRSQRWDSQVEDLAFALLGELENKASAEQR